MLSSLTKAFRQFFGNKSDRDIKELLPLIQKISETYPQINTLSNDGLREKTNTFRKKIQEAVNEEQTEIEKLKQEAENNTALSLEEKEALYEKADKIEESIKNKTEEVLNDILPEVFCVIKETAKRFKENTKIDVIASEFDKELSIKKEYVEIVGTKAIWSNIWLAGGSEVPWDMVHYDVQLIGGVVLHQGKIAEMATGEGKTLVATLPVFLNALPGKGVHVVTVNDYLAKRDSEWMGPIFEFHGLKVDCIDKHEPHSPGRKDAYRADITYGTNNEFGFDYLRDNMAMNTGELVQRKHNYAIVDEVDSVLIDDARTPLIISGPTPKGDIHEFNELKPKVEKLVKAQRALVTTLLADAKKLLSETQETSSGKKDFEKKQTDGGMALLRSYRGLPKNKALIKFLNESGMKTRLQQTENIYLQDNAKEMPKVDAELFFVIDEKNNTIELTEKGIDLITDSSEDHQFFVLPDVGAEIAELEKSSLPAKEKLIKKDNLMRDYSVKVERVHTINQLLKAYCLFEKDVEYVILDNKIKIVDEQTGRIMEGRRYSDGLHQAIEAKENVKIEAATQTYATITLQNYFRMYAKLAGMTGTAETEAREFWEIYKLDVVTIPTNKPIVRDDKEDLVYKTTREKFNAVIDEIVKLTQAKRPVLVGTTSVEVSELLSRMLKLRNIKHNVLNAKLHQKEAEIVAEAGRPGTVTIATNMAGRGTDIKLGPGVKEAGGLAIIGTERHESRRVDRQLRGRSGRQGDPGSSQFFVALDDNLMRLFGSDRIARLMDRMGLQEGEVIQHPLVSRSIERAQKKVEENHFGTRKRLLEYDDVMNSQREVIYKKRKHALFGERLNTDISNSFYDVCESISNEFHESRDFHGFSLELVRTLSIESPVSEDEFVKLSPSEIAMRTFSLAEKHYHEKVLLSAQNAFPVIKNVFETQGSMYENIVVPFSDGRKTLQVVTNLKKAYETEGKELIKSLEKSVTLIMIDQAWKEHLREMDDLRQSVQNAVYEQKDPLLIYKFESFELFKQMLDRVNKEIISFLIKASLPAPEPGMVQRAAEPRKTDYSKTKTGRAELPELANGQPLPTSEQAKPEPVRVEKKVGRNEPCPCGSGKKYKQCHGKGLPE
jgi:preprotein translocase subunit SecA